MRPPSAAELASAVQLAAAVVIVAHLVPALARAARRDLTAARQVAADAIVAGLGLLTAATLLRTVALRTWPQILTLTATLALRLAIKRVLRYERRRATSWAKDAMAGLAALLAAAPAFGQDPVPVARPPFQALRYEEDWSVLRDPRLRTGTLDRLKYLPLDTSERLWLSLGGETRIRYEQYRNPLFGSDPADGGGYLLHRYLLHGDLRVAHRARVFVQLQAALESGRTGGPRGFDENRLDLHQAFGDVSFGGGHRLVIRLGRQELDFGSSRLVSAREMVNVRQTFDGVRVLVDGAEWRVSAWLMRPVLVEHGIFDDSRDSSRVLWGAAWLGPARFLAGGTLAVYYIGLTRSDARFDQGTADERRHTLGARLAGRSAAWDYNIEANVQVGRFGAGRIRAWDAAMDHGIRIGALPLRPRLGLRLDATSGDSDPAEPDLGTFNPLFPNTAYAGLSGLVGPANSLDLQPSLRLFLGPRLSTVAGLTFFWRESTRDGLYGIAVTPQRPGQPSRARSVGRQFALEVDWAPSAHLTWQTTLTYFRAGQYLRDTPPGADVRYLLAWISYRF